MSSHYATTRPTSAPPRTERPSGGGLSITTLGAAAIAAVAAATVVSEVWQPGTIMATAMTPIIIALVKEAVERPARRVSSIAARGAPSPLARGARAVVEPAPEAQAPPPPVGPSPEFTRMRVYGRERAATGRRWKLAIATGLLAFIIGVAVMTLPELVAGRSVVSGTHHTTIFGGHRQTQATPPTRKTTTGKDKTTTEPKGTKTQTEPKTTTTAPKQTQPQPAPQSQQTQPTAPPAQTQPAPQQTQPAAPQPQATTPPPATTTP
jgi:hypothetical protein